MLNMNFDQALAIDTEQMDWLASPSAGVLRKPLEREAKESGHVTSIVQYQPKSFSLSIHIHKVKKSWY